MKYISKTDLVAFTADGIHSFAMEADTPIELPDHMIPPMVALGARPVESAGEQAPQELNQENVLKLATAMRSILAENNAEMLTTDGTVKVTALNAAVGFTSSKPERDAALAIVEA